MKLIYCVSVLLVVLCACSAGADEYIEVGEAPTFFKEVKQADGSIQLQYVEMKDQAKGKKDGQVTTAR